MFSLICAWINGWVNNGKAADLRRHCVHYDVTLSPTWHPVNFAKQREGSRKYDAKNSICIYMIICMWSIKEWALQIWSWSSPVQPEDATLFTISFQCLNFFFFKSQQVFDWLAKWLIMSESMDLRRPRVCRRSNVGLVDYVPIIISSWNFQELLPMTEVTSMQKVKVKGQGHRGQHPT